MRAKGTQADLRQGIGMGADDYLAKPFAANELLATVTVRLVNLESLDFPVEIIPQFMGRPSSQWVFDHLVQPQLGERFPGWYVAYEPETERTYLGETQAAALAAAQRAKPERCFFCRQLLPESKITTPSRSETAE